MMNSFSKIKTVRSPLEDLSYFRDQVASASLTVRTNYLVFVSFTVYLLLLVGATNDLDIALESKFRLPILGIELPVGGTYFIAPLIVVLIHLNLLVHVGVLATKIEALRQLTIRSNERGSHHTEKSLDMASQFLITKSLLSTGQHRTIKFFVHMISITSIFLLPIFLLIAFQIRYLPSHDILMISWQRLLILIDVLLSILVIIRISNTIVGFPTAIYKLVTFPVFGLIILLSIFVVVVPGEILETQLATPLISKVFGDDIQTQNVHYEKTQDVPARESRISTYRKGIFRRNLELSGLNLQKDPNTWVLDLSGRDLRFANFRNTNLDGAILRGTDLSGANLSSTSLREAQLSGALMITANLGGADLTLAELAYADLTGANLYQANLGRAKLMRANLSISNLIETDLRTALAGGASFVGSRIVNVNAQGLLADDADFSHALIKDSGFQGSLLKDSHIGATSFQNVTLFGANFDNVSFDIKGSEYWGNLRKIIEQVLPKKMILAPKSIEYARSLIILDESLVRGDKTEINNSFKQKVFMNSKAVERANTHGLNTESLYILENFAEQEKVEKEIERIFALFSCQSDDLADGFGFHLYVKGRLLDKKLGKEFVRVYQEISENGDCSSPLNKEYFRLFTK